MNSLKTKIGMIALAAILLVPGGKVLAVVAPTITIVGDNPATVTVGGTYTDAGATVTDTFGTPLVVTTTGSVDTATVGSYVLTYSADPISDPENPDGPPLIISSVTRTVNVVAPAVTTNPATSIAVGDATLNGTLGASAAGNESFWVSTSTFDVSTPNIPANVYSTPVLDPVAANGTFSAPLSVVTTNGIITGGANVNMPSITPGTTYYYVAWAYIDGSWTHGEIVSFQTTTNLGTINITKYACSASTTVTRSANGVGGTIPEGCTLESGAYFGYVHGEQSDANAPYPELDSPFTAGGSTNASGTLAISGLPSAGRYLVAETTNDNTKLLDSEILGLYCIGDGDTSDSNDNQELTFVPAGGTVQCIAYNKAAAVPPQSATLVLVKHSIGGDATFQFNLTGSTTLATTTTTVGGYATTTITLNVGTTTISEQSLGGWSFTSANCVYEGESVGSVIAGSEVINVDDGDVVTCTFNNTSNTVGTIKVIKNVLGSDGSTDVEDNHSFNVTLGGETTKAFAENNTVTFEGLAPGNYTITEGSDSDYDLVSISGDVDLEQSGVQVAVVAGLTNTITITNKQHATSTTSSSSNSGNENNGGSSASAGGSIIGWSQGSVLGASTDSPSTCKVLISSYMKRGANNNSEQVKKLQTFLNSQDLGVTVTVNGIFDLPTENAVKLFQEKYAKDILAPWGLTKGTGYVYKTTLRWINHLSCPGSIVPPVSL